MRASGIDFGLQQRWFHERPQQTLVARSRSILSLQRLDSLGKTENWDQQQVQTQGHFPDEFIAKKMALIGIGAVGSCSPSFSFEVV